MAKHQPQKGSKNPQKSGQEATQSRAYYPKPGPIGGRLIRRVIALLRDFDFEIPIRSHILIAVSGGADSVALALLLAKYGRRVVSDTRLLRLLHVNHGWRGQESDRDAQFVVEFGRKLDLPVDLRHLSGPPTQKGNSWENEARKARKQVFAHEAARHQALVFSAHHGDDLAETVLWRLLTGNLDTQGAGIAVRHGIEVRPLLRIQKNELRAFLEEEGQPWREDSTNHEGRFQRSQMRQRLLPAIEELFPRAIEHLIDLGLTLGRNAHRKSQQEEKTGQHKKTAQDFATLADSIGAEALLGTLGGIGIRLRRSHLEWVSAKMSESQAWKGELSLPEGWRLSGERQKIQSGKRARVMERWTLERDKTLELKGNDRSPSGAVN